MTWLTPKEVAELVERNPVRIYLALESGELHGHQRVPNGRWSVHTDSVRAWQHGADTAAACGCRPQAVTAKRRQGGRQR
ncbi:hypothetical protein EV191_11355 [Tamaricihabitans halophyticus]|uniref:Excisionase family DNA binding protein n=1 Tax=Tamaricihabitans halophyticus TaxID=1262583 RepID=A0A4R2QDR9_9PSEU|nr:hypothetical protein [Tamaricihabitans halophyticus]TCP46779.1 hypothetical protein EV191_11355 [Tamaricihabitans halophyticus]